MNIQKLGERLSKEVARNKVKTAVLGVLLLVAIYFWAPLIWGWIAPEGSSASAQPAATAGQTTAPAAAQGDGRPAAKALSWRRILELRESTLLASPARWTEETRDPFQPSERAQELLAQQQIEQAQEEQQEQRSVAEAAPTEAEFDQSNLKLTGVVVGPRFRSASINGVMMPEKTRFAVGSGGGVAVLDRNTSPAGDTAVYVLLEVKPDSVLLAGAQGAIRLRREAPRLSQADRILIHAGGQ